MNIVHRQHGGIQHYQQGLGLFNFLKKIKVGKWLKKAGDALINTVCSTVDSATFGLFSSEIDKVRAQAIQLTAQLANAIDGSAMKTAAPYEPTASEQAILNNWLFNKFTPFTKILAQELGAASILTDPQAKLNAVNAVENKINLIQDHYAVAETAGLSQDAQDIRQYLVYEGLRPIDETIKAMIAKIGVSVIQEQVTFKPSLYNMAPLFTTTIITSVTGYNYKVSTGKPTTVIPIPQNIGTTKTPASVINPVKQTSIIKGQELELPAIITNTTKNTTLTDPNAGDTSGKSGNKVMILAALAAAGAIAYVAIKSGNSKPKIKTVKP